MRYKIARLHVMKYLPHSSSATLENKGWSSIFIHDSETMHIHKQVDMAHCILVAGSDHVGWLGCGRSAIDLRLHITKIV